MDYRNIIKNRELRLKIINLLRFIPDIPYLKMVYKIKTGRWLNLKHPRGFNEKMQWLKIYDRHPEYSDFVDKYKVRNIVLSSIGEEYLIPLLGHWAHYRDIDFSKLPDKFVLKCNHDSGSVKIVLDKANINHKEFEDFFENRLRINAFNIGREYPYKEVKPLILAEKFMDSEDGKGITDYKFFCFHGEPKLMFVATERNSGDTKFDFYDMEYNHLPIYNIHRNADVEPKRTVCFAEMKSLAAKLSKGFKFVRMDFYVINDKVYFGEYTFYHGGGFWLFEPEEYEQKLGAYLRLPCDNIVANK